MDEENFLKEQEAGASANNKKGRGRPRKNNHPPKPTGEWPGFMEACTTIRQQYVYVDDRGYGTTDLDRQPGIAFWDELEVNTHYLSDYPGVAKREWKMSKQAPWCYTQGPYCNSRPYTRCITCSDNEDHEFFGDVPVCYPCYAAHMKIHFWHKIMPSTNASQIIKCHN